jgi:LuxR family transcriptional regulator, maltose regulon positive regulatory protein
LNPIPLIHTKILIPAVKDHDLHRANLTKKLKGIPKCPLTIVHASCGYGKTKAIALFAREEKMRCCWYSVSESDEPLFSFFTYLTTSIQWLIPKFGEEMLKIINLIDKEDSEQVIKLLFSSFINEVLSAKEEFILIVDDFQKIEHSVAVNRFMEFLLEHMPQNLHLVIISRTWPGLESITGMRIKGEVLEVTKRDLVLSTEEVELWLNENYGLTLNEIGLNRIYQLSQGWFIALVMIADQLKDSPEPSDCIFRHSFDYTNLFQYLEMEVFRRLDIHLQHFLEQTSIFEKMSEEICQDLLGMNNFKNLIELTFSKNLFIEMVGNKHYCYHPLFRKFLEERVIGARPKMYESINTRAANYFKEKLNLEKALDHFEKINKTGAVAGILQEHGLKLLESGDIENLHERLSRIPDSEKDRSFILWFLHGEIYRYRSSYKKAEVCYQKAINASEKNNDKIGLCKALEGKARIYLDTIQPFHAERLLNEAIEILEQSSPHSQTEIAGLYQLLAENLINLGHASKAEQWLLRAKKLNVLLNDGNLEARLYMRTGRYDKAEKSLLDERENQENGNSPLPQSHRETELLLSLIAALTGNGERAKELAQQGIQHGLNMKAPFVEACAWIRMGHAVQLMDQYDLKLAVNCYNTALEMMDNLKLERGKAEALMGLLILYGIRGEYQRAIKVGEFALKETERVKDVWLSAWITLCMGIASFYSGHSAKAINWFEKGEEMFHRCEDKFGQTLSHFWLALQHFHLGNGDSFNKNISDFIKELQKSEYEFFLYKRTLFGPRDLQAFAPLLIEAEKLRGSSNYINYLLREMNLFQMDSHPGYTLRVQALGSFRVWIGEKEVEERGWQRGKAKELLQLFITYRRQMLSKDEIFQFLWPGQGEKNAARDFKVALNALNHVLEPQRKARANSFFIIREGKTYGLNPHAGLEVDTQFFEQWLTAGLEEKNPGNAIVCLKKGLTYYKGEFLPDRRYDDWCINERERLLTFFLRGAEKLAQTYVRQEQYDAAIDWCQKIVSKDRTWEEAYRLLMYCYYRKNNRPQAIKWYHKCCEILEQELGVSPLEPTINMYEMILEADVK